MYRYYNPNPSGKVTGDCVIRGLCKILKQSWDETYIGVFLEGYLVKDMMSANSVWESYLSTRGFRRTLLPDTCPMCYTVRQFCFDHPKGSYLLATGTHVVAVENGDYYDAWDSGEEVPIYYWRFERSKSNGKF